LETLRRFIYIVLHQLTEDYLWQKDPKFDVLNMLKELTGFSSV